MPDVDNICKRNEQGSDTNHQYTHTLTAIWNRWRAVQIKEIEREETWRGGEISGRTQL